MKQLYGIFIPLFKSYYTYNCTDHIFIHFISILFFILYFYYLYFCKQSLLYVCLSISPLLLLGFYIFFQVKLLFAVDKKKQTKDLRV